MCGLLTQVCVIILAKTLGLCDTPPADLNRQPTMSLPTYKTQLVDLWGAKLPHIEVAPGQVDVVLEDAVKEFSGITDQSNMSKEMRKAIEAVTSGAKKNR